MVNKQKIWFLTLFSLILVLSVYYITMPSELLTTNNNNVSKKTTIKKENVSIEESDIFSVLEIEKNEERSLLAAEYNEILTNSEKTSDEKNNAYEGLKKIDEIKSNEEKLTKKIKKELNFKSFVKIDGDNINVVINKKEHDYSLANKIMRLIQAEFDDKKYISVKFQK